jgi:hypothetical protein
MKLTIKNYEKIIDTKLKTDSEWTIKAVIERPDRYTFNCFKVGIPIQLCELNLSRLAETDIFYFIPDRHFGVTAAWIGNMGNLINTISEQVKNFEYNNY